MQFNIIGAGRLGKNLALSLMTHGKHQLLAICNQHLPSALEAIHQLQQGEAVASLALLPPAELTLITAPDDQIANIATHLATLNVITPGSIVAHCSGVLSSQALQPLQKQGCYIASLHPLKAFRAHYIEKQSFAACLCTLEGDEPAVQCLTTLLTAMNAEIVHIQSAKKQSYHAAAVIASNFMVTIASCAETLLLETGLTLEQAQRITRQLMNSSCNNLQHSSETKDALTGPFVRGDVNTIATHLQAIDDAEILQFYRLAGLLTLRLTHLPTDKITAIQHLLMQEK